MGVTWLSSYPRSGNTWMRFLLSSYVFGQADTWRDGVGGLVQELQFWLKKTREEGVPTEDILRQIEELAPLPHGGQGCPRHRMIKTHYVLNERLPLLGHTRAFIYVLRHPKDVLLSGLNWTRLTTDYSGSDRDYAEEFIRVGGDPVWKKVGFGTWEEHARSWLGSKEFPHILVRYEDLHTQPECELRRIVEFLALPVSEERLAQAVKHSTLERLRRLELTARQEGKFFPANEGYYFMHKGHHGQRLASIAPELDDAFDERFATALAEFGYALPHEVGAHMEQV